MKYLNFVLTNEGKTFIEDAIIDPDKKIFWLYAFGFSNQSLTTKTVEELKLLTEYEVREWEHVGWGPVVRSVSDLNIEGKNTLVSLISNKPPVVPFADESRNPLYGSLVGIGIYAVYANSQDEANSIVQTAFSEVPVNNSGAAIRLVYISTIDYSEHEPLYIPIHGSTNPLDVDYDPTPFFMTSFYVNTTYSQSLETNTTITPVAIDLNTQVNGVTVQQYLDNLFATLDSHVARTDQPNYFISPNTYESSLNITGSGSLQMASTQVSNMSGYSVNFSAPNVSPKSFIYINSSGVSISSTVVVDLNNLLRVTESNISLRVPCEFNGALTFNDAITFNYPVTMNSNVDMSDNVSINNLTVSGSFDGVIPNSIDVSGNVMTIPVGCIALLHIIYSNLPVQTQVNAGTVLEYDVEAQDNYVLRGVTTDNNGEFTGDLKIVGLGSYRLLTGHRAVLSTNIKILVIRIA